MVTETSLLDKINSYGGFWAFLALTIPVFGFVIYIIKKISIKKENTGIMFNYMRLFGAVGIQEILKAIETKTISSVHPGNIRFFLEKWEYKEALLVISEVSEWIKEQDVVRLVLSNIPESNISKYIPYTKIVPIKRLSGSYILETDPPVSEEDMKEYYGNKDLEYVHGLHDLYDQRQANYAVLLLILKNCADNTINNLKIDYELISKDQTNMEIKSNHVPYLESYHSLIWVLQMYLSTNENKYSGKVLSPNIRPLYLSFDLGSKTVKKRIRLPYKDKALRVSIPSGWYYQ